MFPKVRFHRLQYLYSKTQPDSLQGYTTTEICPHNPPSRNHLIPTAKKNNESRSINCFFLDRTKIRRWTNGEIFTLTLSLAFQKTLKFAIKSLIWNLFHFVPHKRDTTKTSTYVFWAVREQWKIFSLRLFTSIPNLQTSPPLAPGVYFLPVSKHFSRQRFSI